MTTWRRNRLLALLGLLALCVGGARLAPALSESGASSQEAAPTVEPDPGGESADPERRDAVLVELFTSQGCSSCPPADRLLTRLGGSATLDGVRVVPLSFHVDYWNYIGWTDPFSSADWSARQRSYGRRFALGSVYTPQIVVDGAGETVGSNEREVRGLIAAAARRPAGGEIVLESRGLGGGELSLRLAATLAASAGPGAVDAWVALYENGLTTPVGRGENATRTLRNDHVVRRLERAFTLDPTGRRNAADLRLPVDASWARERLGVAAFLQHAETLAIHGVAWLEPGGLASPGGD